MGRRRAECSRLRDGNEYGDVIEIGRFAHAQHSSASTDHSPEEQYLEQGNSPFRDSRQPGDLGTAQQNRYR